MANIMRNIFLVIWTIFCSIGVIGNFSHYQAIDWLFVIPFVTIPYLLIWLFSKKSKKHMESNTLMNELVKEVVTPNSKYIETENVIYRTDGETISDEEVPYLAQKGYQNALEAERESSNPKFHRTEHEEELSFNFEMKYGNQINILTSKFEQLYRDACKTNDLSERISLLNDASTAYENAKKFCYSKGKGGTIFFQDMWECLHNSQNSCYSYLDTIKNSLNEAVLEHDVIIPGILRVISDHDGILQKNLYQELPDIDKSRIQRIVKFLEANKEITRVKKSNSYELHITK